MKPSVLRRSRPIPGIRRRPAQTARMLALSLATSLALGVFGGIRSLPAAASPNVALTAQADPEYSSLRVYGYPVVSNPNGPAQGNWPASAGSNVQLDPLTGQIPEDPPYTDQDGPFDPYHAQAPEMDVVTWNPAWANSTASGSPT